jgi:multidrug resistance efflux pump
MGQQMGSAMVQLAQAPATVKNLKEDLTEIKDLFDGQVITQAEFDQRRSAIMARCGMV